MRRANASGSGLPSTWAATRTPNNPNPRAGSAIYSGVGVGCKRPKRGGRAAGDRRTRARRDAWTRQYLRRRRGEWVYDLWCRNEENNSPSAETLRGFDSREDVGVLATGHEGGEEFDPRFGTAAHCRPSGVSCG